MKTPNRTLLLSLLVALMGTGCATTSSRYSCPAPDGVACMSPTEVYRATNSLDSLEGYEAPKNARSAAGRAPSADTAGIALAQGSLMLSTPAPATPISEPAPTLVSDEPFRTPAQVMRIWLASWEDEAGDLHMPGYVFSEIEARRWTVGVEAVEAPRTLQLFAPSDSASADSP